MSALVTGLLEILAKAGFSAILDEIAAPISAWYISKQKVDAVKEILDAAAFALHNQDTEEGRYQSAERWQKALSRPRVS